MATITVRAIDDDLKARLRTRAAAHGHSMEAEVRQILRDSLMAPSPPGRLGSRIRDRVAGLELDLELPAREEAARAAVFDG